MRFLLTFLILFISANILLAQKPKFKKVTKQELEQKRCAIDSLAKAEYLFKGCEVSYDYNQNENRFDVIYRYQERIKIYDDDYTDIANYSIRFFQGENNSKDEQISGIEAYTFNLENGKVVKEKVSKKNMYEEEESKFYKIKKFAFPAIKNGSILEVKYELRSQYYFSIDEFYFQAEVPVKYTEYRISVPEYFFYNTNVKGLVSLGVETKEKADNYSYSYKVNDGTKISPKNRAVYKKVDFEKIETVYTASDIPAISNELYVYTMDNYRSSIQHELRHTRFPRSGVKYYTKSWDDIADLLQKNEGFGRQLDSNYDQYDDLLNELKDKDLNERISTIYDTIQNDFTWNGYLSASTSEEIKNLIKKGIGNIAQINLLLVNLLQKAGVNALPMVSRASASGFLNITNPSITQLNYVVAFVEIDGKYLYLDATDKNMTINALPKRALNLKGIVINDDKGIERILNNPNNGKANNVYSLSIDGESMVGTRTHSLSGYEACSVRSRFSDGDEYVKSLNCDRISFSNSNIENYSNREDAIKLTGDVSANGFVQNVEDKIFVDLKVSDEGFENPFKAEERKFALFFENAYSNVDLLKVKIPEGYQVESIPENLNVGIPEKMFVARINFNVVGEEVVMTKKVTLKQSIIIPEYYQALKTVYEQIEALFNEKIVFTKIP